MMPRSIAKVNAKSIDGFFGIGTSCFFIRGTILSDTPIEGEYPSLNFMRPGNTIEVESFDRIWAVVKIQTRAGNRPGDNVTARLYLRDDDLKAHGVDCERIELLNGLPFSFDVASLAAEGLFDHHDLEPYTPVADDPDPPHVAPAAPAPQPVAQRAAPPPPAPPPRPAPPPAPAPAPPPPAPAAPPPVPPAEEPVAAVPEAGEPAPAVDLARIMEILRTRATFSENPYVQVGASVAAVAVPVLLYVALNYLKGKPEGDDDPG